jgi:two-component system, chemotaxis family, chemotaxis protein CheY
VDDAKVVLVGHCGPDAYALRAAIRSFFPRGSAVMVNGDDALQAELARADVLLVNRALDGDFAVGSGVDLIRTLAARPLSERPAMVLVSNFADAQEAALAAGAMPGFGKRQMYSPEMRKNLEAAVAARRAAGA